MVNSKIKNIAKTFGYQLLLPAEKGIDWDIAVAIAMEIAQKQPLISGEYEEIYNEIICIVDPILEEITQYEAKKHIPLVFDRNEWIVTTVESMKTMFKDIIDEYWENLENNLESSQKRNFVKKITKSTITSEIGLLIGYLSNKVLAQYDMLVPERKDSYLYFIEPNIQMRQKQLGLESSLFRFWITLHELAHKYQFDNNPWIKQYYFKLIEAAKEVINKPEKENNKASFGLFLTSSNRELISKIQAFMSLIEGYADFIMFTAAKRLPDYERTAPIFLNRKSGGPVKEVFNKMLGFDLKLNQYKTGYRFVSAVTNAYGISFLHNNLKDGRSLPTLQEITEPELWIKRVANS